MDDDAAATEAVDTSSMAVWPLCNGRYATTATQGAGTERLRAKQPLDVRTATKGLFGLGAAGNAAALKALFDDCVLIDHTAQVRATLTLSPSLRLTPTLTTRRRASPTASQCRQT